MWGLSMFELFSCKLNVHLAHVPNHKNIQKHAEHHKFNPILYYVRKNIEKMYRITKPPPQLKWKSAHEWGGLKRKVPVRSAIQIHSDSSELKFN